MTAKMGPVFVSYAHKGKGADYLDLCKKVVAFAGLDTDIWTDERIPAGADWQREIETALVEASAAILLVDWEFLDSHYITRKEIPSLFVAAAGLATAVGGESFASRIPIIPILVESCPYEGPLPWLNQLQIEPEASLRKLIDPRRERFKDLLTLDELESPDRARFKTALAKRLGGVVRPRVVTRAEALPEMTPAQATIDTPAHQAMPDAAPRRHSRYLARGEDLSGDHVTLQLNLAHAEFSTYRIDTRYVYRDGSESRSEYHQGLATLPFAQVADNAVGESQSHPGSCLLDAVIFSTPRPGDAYRSGLSCIDKVGAETKQRIGECIEKARAKARELGLPMQLQLGINEDAGELCEIPWESLPLDDGKTATTSEEMLFSRAILASGAEAVECRTRARDALRVLAAYSDVGMDPTDGADPSLQQKIQQEMMQCMAPMATDNTTSRELLRPDADVLLDHLSAGSPYDVLYLACEGLVSESEYYLRLPDRDLSRAELACHFRSAPIPRLVILVPAHQLADGPENPESTRALMHFAALFSRLGAASVLTCQKAMPSNQWNAFLFSCFESLAAHGHVPGAAAEARAATLDGGEWWRPVLVSRPKALRMWYRPGFVSDVGTEANWESLITSLSSGRFCPVIGPGIHYQLEAARLELAREMADEFDYPLEFSNRISLPAVAQYVRALEPNTEVFCAKLEQRIRKLLGGVAGIGHELSNQDSLYDLACRVGREILAREPDNPYNLLAKLPVSLYLNANLDPFLEVALELVKEQTSRPVEPQVAHIRRFDFTRVDPDKADTEGVTTLPINEFSPREPLVMQLYGNYQRLNHAAIAEDDYFQFLATFSGRIADVKGPLEGKLGESDLIFLGFKWNSLDFRVLFRALQKYARIMPAVSYHIAVQMDPDNDETIRPDKVLEYLRRYFAGGKQLQQARLSLFWGSTEDFLKELVSRL